VSCKNSAETPKQPVRVVSYIDGFNLYFGLHDAGLRKYYWLNLQKLSKNLLQQGQVLLATKYFTSRISGAMPGDPPRRATALNEKCRRQAAFLDALKTEPQLHVYEGHYLSKPVTSHKCGAWWRTYEEKMTDVNIATELLLDAMEDRYDTALLISADSDLAPPVRAVRQHFPDKRIVVAFPLGRNSAQLKQVANAYFTIGEQKYRTSQFPDQVTLPNAHILNRPGRWQ
jgi:uncharacterized LabA/DUF88 family protein